MGVSEIEKLERRHAENPNGTVFAVLADHYRRVGDIGRALDLLGPGLALHPEYIPASIVLGRCHLALGDDAQAESAFTRVLSLDPENVIALRELAGITERQGRFDDAERWVRMLLLIDRDSEEAKAQLARIEEARGAAPSAPATEPGPPAVAVVEAPVVEAAAPEEPVGADLPVAEPARADVPPPVIEPEPEPATSAPASVAGLELETPPSAVEMEPLAGLVVEETAYGWVAPVEDAAEAEVAVFGELDLEPGAGVSEVVRNDEIELVSSMSADFERYDMAAQLDATAAAPSDEVLAMPADADVEPGASPLEAPPVEPVPEPVAAVAEVEPDDAPAEVEPAPVLTETMAELYVRQGHHGEAVAVYRGLLARQPGDLRLRARLDELEAALAAAAPPRRVRAAETGGLSVAGLFTRMLAAAPAADQPAATAASYDEFFAAPAAAEPAPAADVAAGGGEADDLEQFQAWLQKLKR